MPNAAGRTIALLSLITSYSLSKPKNQSPKLIYFLAELRVLVDYQLKHLGAEAGILALGLSTRKNLCINPSVNPIDSRDSVDAACRKLTASWVREAAVDNPGCDLFENYEKAGLNAVLPPGVYTLQDLRTFGKEKGCCPYYLSRRMVQCANVVVCSYQYLLDPKVSGFMSKEMKRECVVVVFDEAQDIDNVCIEALSVSVRRQTLEGATRNLDRMEQEIGRLKVTNPNRLQKEYNKLVEGLAQRETTAITDDWLAIRQPVSGNIRRAEHFIGVLRRLISYLERCLRENVETERLLTFANSIDQKAGIDKKVLRFCYDRLRSLMMTLKITNTDEFLCIQTICDFATLVGTYTRGFSVINEHFDERTSHISDPVLQLCCHDASLAMKPVFERFQSVVLPVSTKFKSRSDPSVTRNYGRLLLEMVAAVPDGVVCFFDTYSYMESIVGSWNEMGILQDIMQHKLVFVETEDVVQTTLALDNYRRACDCGRGAVFVSVARGKVAEGIDFDRHYGRLVIIFGVPFQYTLSRVLRARMEYLQETCQIKVEDFMTFDAMRQAAQCVGRVIRSKADYGIMILADKRYSRQDKLSKLPPWILSHLPKSHQNLSTDMALRTAKEFPRKLAQPQEITCAQGNMPTIFSEDDLRML
ncbi:hypothetical protein MKW98_017123 [Papaver atlanticum]|uniref:DNA 5'-3' helicase n=1 Tax=Papaver atlanticum TaxID=357466 RepID=A0AAD4XYM0_9MAGN|nr:hypothetical protein MKW98_017123 [Papaver atlanticum]